MMSESTVMVQKIMKYLSLLIGVSWNTLANGYGLTITSS